ncbi:zinc-finger-containing protein [Flavobacterium sp. SUN046]|uniref:zinc-finger-containing protein n=1 Tax=Flavobacterium sp. SUN046 TaxID=3002440 RepID=UPI002DBCEB99|nr:zinc-finger-containing protein [Flavobacterium sp. SUN046]MEC4049307.1 zinc-finger-containing protein [Flavobacterium sp. SUN046]
MELTPFQKDVIHAKVCPYCNSSTKIISETEVYGREYKGRKLIACVNFPKCDSYVGTHDDGTALGRLANKNLRNRKKQAHFWFDKIWQEKYLERGELYQELSEFLDLPPEYTHVGMFSETMCIKTENWAKKYYNELSNSHE